MYGKAVLVIATTVIILLMLFGNAKVRVFSVLVNQIKVFKNAKTEKLSWWDIVCFIIMPICLAIILTIGFRCIIDDDLASVLTTVFAFVFTVLFGFAAAGRWQYLEKESPMGGHRRSIGQRTHSVCFVSVDAP